MKENNSESKESFNPMVKKGLLIFFQIFPVQGWDVRVTVGLAQQSVFVFPELVE